MPEIFDKAVKHIKESLRKEHPNWSEDKISSVAYGRATIQYKEKYGKLPRRKE